MTVLESFYEQTHDPEALGLSRKSTVIVMYLLVFVLPYIARLRKCLKTEKLNLTAISGLVDSTLLTLDDLCCQLQIGCWSYWMPVTSFELPQKSKLTLNQSTPFKKTWINLLSLT